MFPSAHVETRRSLKQCHNQTRILLLHHPRSHPSSQRPFKQPEEENHLLHRPPLVEHKESSLPQHENKPSAISTTSTNPSRHPRSQTLTGRTLTEKTMSINS